MIYYLSIVHDKLSVGIEARDELTEDPDDHCRQLEPAFDRISGRLFIVIVVDVDVVVANSLADAITTTTSTTAAQKRRRVAILDKPVLSGFARIPGKLVPEVNLEVPSEDGERPPNGEQQKEGPGYDVAEKTSHSSGFQNLQVRI